MKFKILLVAFVTLLMREQSNALDGYNLDEKNDARLYMATFMKNNGTRAWISCTGTFVKKNYVLTAASCVQGDFHSLDLRSGQVNVFVVGGGNRHSIQKVHFHPKYDTRKPFENNIALVEVESVHPLIEPLRPQDHYKIISNRICTMFGWEGYNTNQDFPMRLRMYAVPVGANQSCDPEAPEAYCSLNGLSSNYNNCGGLMGAPVFCSGHKISGIVVNDKFCKNSKPVRGSFLSLGDVKDFLKSVLDPPPPTTTTASAVGLMMSKLAMLIPIAICARKLM